MAKVALAMPKKHKPVLKTYSRKKKGSPEAKPTSSESPAPSTSISFLPPNYPSLVAFRGILLHRRELLKASEVPSEDAGESETTKKKRKPSYFRFSDDKEQLQRGICQPDIMVSSVANEEVATAAAEPGPSSSAATTSASASRRQTEAEADELLFQRIKALFMWPNLLAANRPILTKREADLFLEPEPLRGLLPHLGPSSVAAKAPFDATEIIENVPVIQPPAAKRTRIKVEPED